MLNTRLNVYTAVEKLRSGEPLTEKERKVHEIAACGVLRDLHDELDRLVALGCRVRRLVPIQYRCELNFSAAKVVSPAGKRLQ